MSFSIRSLSGSLLKNVGRFAVTRLVFNSYSWGRADERRIETGLNSIRVEAYRNMLIETAGQAGCVSPASRARGPSGNSLAALRSSSKSEASGIVETYNNDLRQEVARLFEANPRGLRNHYRDGISSWFSGRQDWKAPQISLVTVQSARSMALADFNARNKALFGERLFRFTGPPPRESECAELMAMGAVDQSIVDANPVPIHIGCPHSWTPLPPNKQVNCSDIWVG